MLRKSLNQRRTDGFTLIELAIVLTVVGAIVAVIWTSAATVSQNNSVNHAIQQITEVVQNIRDQFANTQNPPGWAAGSDITSGSATSLDGLQLFPAEMRQNPALGYGAAGETIVHALNGSFQVVQPSSTVGAVPNAIMTPACANFTCFRLVLNGLPQPACVKFLEAMPVTDTAMGIVQVGVTNTSGTCTSTACVQTCAGTPCFFTAPLPVATASGWCDGTANDNIAFVDFKLHN
jgi:prepilin-type N-terminal cleavage/methylation domain-containing protein